MKYKIFFLVFLSLIVLLPFSFAAPISETGNMTLGSGNQTSGSNVGLGANASTATTSTTTTTTAAGGGVPQVISGGYSAGGGAAATTATTTTTAAPQVTTISSITAGSSATVTIENSDALKVQSITIDAKNTVTNVQITVKETSLPAGTAVAIASDTGAVFKYLEISKVNITDNDISKVKIKFKVDKAWLDQNNIDPATISLQKLVGNSWQKQSTTKVSEDSNYVYYEAESSTLSLFSITGQKKTVPTTATTTPTTTTTPVIPPLPAISTPIWYVIAILIIVLVAYVFLFRKRKIFSIGKELPKP